MNFAVVCVTILVACFLAPTPALAHGVGLPPYARINGNFSTTYPVQKLGTTSVITSQSFLIPQDSAPDTYVVNEPISFAIDQTQLETMIAKEFLAKTTYMWDFGDNNKADGLRTSHIYTKPGSYIIKLTLTVAIDPTQPAQFVDTYLVNILPSNDFSGLPQAVLKVNGKTYKEQSAKLVDSDFSREITFNATDSIAPLGVKAYLWDLGDGTTASGPKITHVYKNQYYDVVVLRVIDTSGFISDDYVGLKDIPESDKRPTEPPPISFSAKKKPVSPSTSHVLVYFAPIALILLAVSWIFHKIIK